MTAMVVSLGAYRGRPGRLLMLVRRVAMADQAAFARLHRALEPAVTAVVHRLLGDGAQADEVSAATFLEVWQCADLHTAPETDVTGWVVGIAARRAGEQHDPRTRSHPSGQDHSAGAALAELLNQRSARRNPFRRV